MEATQSHTPKLPLEAMPFALSLSQSLTLHLSKALKVSVLPVLLSQGIFKYCLVPVFF
jgi:hypothetical protein